MNKKYVLIADDDVLVLTVLKISLEYLLPDYQIITVKDGAMALAELEHQSFDLILTDYDMPRMNGLELAQAAHQISPNSQIILMTGNHCYIDEIKTEAGSANLNGFLAKPFTMWQLRETLQAIKQAGCALDISQNGTYSNRYQEMAEHSLV
jgi:CheY-like chemotaxis protein